MEQELMLKPVQRNGSVTMEEVPFEPPYITINDGVDLISNSKPFLQANTIESSLSEIKNKHLIPVYIKDNEPLISHSDFIEKTMQITANIFKGETILKPNVRLSHEIKGRIPSAKLKPANELLEHERTVYYERMAFVIEIPTISSVVDGCSLSLTVGGVKAFNLDNMYNKKGADEHFKIFIGFKNSVCTNLCVSTDGFMGTLTVKDIASLGIAIRSLLEGFNHNLLLHTLGTLSEYSITEQQFANIMGRCRMYQYLPKSLQNTIQPMLYGDNQLGAVIRDYYRDESFCKNEDGTINLFRLYNLFTGSNKSSYIDSFLDRSVNAFSFAYALKMALDDKQHNWFLN
jgi:hypothetical protein